MRHLQELGANDVIHPELEGGLQVVRHTLLRLGFPLREVQNYADVVRAKATTPRSTPTPSAWPSASSWTPGETWRSAG